MEYKEKLSVVEVQYDELPEKVQSKGSMSSSVGKTKN